MKIVDKEPLTMYIKNRRDSNKIKDFGSYQTLCLTESYRASKSPTFHILTVSGNKKL
jgi:hypothetical protein